VLWSASGCPAGDRLDRCVGSAREWLSQPAAGDLLAAAAGLVDAAVVIVPELVYAPAEQRALARIPRDPDDWPTVALAMVLDAGIWTMDANFSAAACRPG